MDRKVRVEIEVSHRRKERARRLASRAWFARVVLMPVGKVHARSACRVRVAVECAPESDAAQNNDKNGRSSEAGDGAGSQKKDGKRAVSEQKTVECDWLP